MFAGIGNDCNVTYFTPDAMERVMALHPSGWDKNAVAIFFLIFAFPNMRIDPQINPDLAEKVFNEEVSGTIFMSMTSNDAQAMGFTSGAATNFVTRREEVRFDEDRSDELTTPPQAVKSTLIPTSVQDAPLP